MSPRLPTALQDRRPGEATAGTPPKPDQAVFLTADLPGERLDVFVARAVAGLSRSAAQRLIAEGLVTVEDNPGRAAQRLAGGATVALRVPAPRPSALIPEPMPIVVVYEDGDLLVLDKPAGLVVHPGPGHRSSTLVHGLLAYCTDLSGIGGEERPGIVHRLDRDTSGLLMVAKHDQSHAALSRQLSERRIDKYYLAAVESPPRPLAGLIDAPIGRHPRDRRRMAVRDDGRPARTRYWTLGAEVGRSLLLLRLETGRTHQIRVHLMALGCPVLGDPLYGRGEETGTRLWLHAWRLALTLPAGGRQVLEAPLPAELRTGWQVDWERILDRARRVAVDTAPS